MATPFEASVAAHGARLPVFPQSFNDPGIIEGFTAANPIVNTEKDLLVVSPYQEEAHQLDLNTLDTSNQLLAKALVIMKSLREDYATSPYEETFNWSEIVNYLRQLAETSNFEWKEAAFYIVVFRSRIPPTTAYADLGDLDKDAHAEAMRGGGFLKYWFGFPDHHGRNLATCVWRRPEDAKAGSVGPAHRKAASATRYLYSEWKIERLRLLIKEGAKDWEIGQWID